MNKLKRVLTALAVVFGFSAAWAATPVAVWDGNFSSSELTKFTGYELVDWNQTHGENNSTVTIDRSNQGLMFRSSTGKAGVTVLVRYSNLQAGTNNRVLFTTTINNDYTATRTGIRMDSNGALRGIWGNTEWNDNRNQNYGSVPASGVMAFTYSKAGTYLYTGSNADRLAETWKCTSLMSSTDTDSSQIRGVSIGGYNEGASANGYEAALGMTIDAVAVFDSVITLDEMQDYTWPSEESSVCAVSRTVVADATVNWTDAAWTVGETADQTFTPSADVLYTATVTVGGDCAIVMPETIGNFNRRKIKFVLDSGVNSATVSLKYPGTLPESGNSIVLNPFGEALVIAGSGVTLSPGYNGDTAGCIVSVSDLTVTIVKGSNYEGTLTADTNWSDIKPEGWANAIAGNDPSIVVNYEGEEPITLTFDEEVAAGSLTLTGNIVVEASAAATFGTVTAGAGSVVEMANMTITTQAGAGTYRYRSNYPGTVPNQSLTYEYVGGADSESAGAVTLSGMRGTVKTTGFMNISGYYPLNTASHLDVVSGTTTLTAGSQGICGYITIREGATLVNTTTDSLAYSSYNSTIDIYGTLDMGTSRWTTWSGAEINLRGGEITGVGESENGAIDLMGTGNVHAYADSTISANVKFRNALSNVTVDDGVTLTISGETKPGYNGGGITKKGAGTLKFTSDPYVPGGIVVEAGTLAFDTESDVDPVVTYTAAVLKDANMDYVDASNWKGRVVVSAVEAGNTATQVALDKTGNANSYLTLNGISGNAWCAGSTYTVQPAITLAGNVNFQNGSSNKTVTFRKIASGSGNLSLKSWYGCAAITYGFTTLDADNYTGTIQLDGSVLTFNVGDILKAGAVAGDKVLPLTVANNATVNLSGATLNGEAADLEVKEDGIYVAYPTVATVYASTTTSYTTLQDAVTAAVATRNSKLVLTASTATEAATIPAVASAKFYVVANGNALGLINNPVGDYIVKTTSETITIDGVGEDLSATVYSVTAAAVAVTASGTTDRVLYDATQAPAAVNNAAEGGLNTKIEFVNGTDASAYETLLTSSGFTLSNGVWTLTTLPVAQLTHGVQVSKYLTLDAAIEAAVTDDTITLLQAVTDALVLEKAVTIDVGDTVSFGLGIDITVEGGYVIGDELSFFLGDTTWIVETISGEEPNRRVKYGYGERRTVKMDYLSGNGAVDVTIGDLVKKVSDDEAAALGGPLGVYFYVKDGADISFTATPLGDRLVSSATIKVGEADATPLTDPVSGVYSANITGDSVINVEFAYPVAQVGDTPYLTLEAAIEAAGATAGTVKLLADINVVETGLTFPAGKTVTFDLNGYTLTGGNTEVGHIQVNGAVTITDSSEGAEGKIVSGATGTYGLVQVAENATQEGAALTIAGGTIESYFPSTLTDAGQHPAYGVAIKGKDTVFNMTGGKVKAGLMAIMGHGSKATAGTYTISGGTIESVDDFALYMPTKGGCSVTISGGTFIGKGGVCVRAGTLNVTGGTFTASGTGIAPGASAGTTGASFAGLSVWPNYGAIEVTVSDGSFTSATGVDAIVSTTSKFTATVSLSGGTYSSDVKAFCAAGKTTKPGTTWSTYEVVDAGIDPADANSKQEVAVEVDTTGMSDKEAQAAVEAAAVAAASVEIPSDVAAAMTAAAHTLSEDIYKGYFSYTVTETATPGVYEVKIADLNKEVVFPAAEAAQETADLADVLDAAVEAPVEITTAKPGLYYSIEAATDLGFTAPEEGVRTLATGTTVSPKKPAVDGTPDAVFYRVKVSATPNN